jgi:hypothetical protein
MVVSFIIFVSTKETTNFTTMFTVFQISSNLFILYVSTGKPLPVNRKVTAATAASTEEDFSKQN